MNADVSLLSRHSRLFRPLQTAVVDRLASHALIRSIPVIERKRNVIKNDIDAAIAQIGICLFVFPPVPVRAVQGGPAWFDVIRVRVRTIEAPTLNKAGLDAYDLIELIFQRLDGWTPVIHGAAVNALELAPEPFEDVNDPARTLFDHIFHIAGGIEAAPDL